MSSYSKDIVLHKDTKIHYEVCDLNHGKLALVFLHGMGGNLRSWDKEREFFHLKKISTLAIDLRGHGLSKGPDNPDKYKISDFADDVSEVLKKEKFKNFIIVGHCLGGMVTIDFELRYPKLSRADVLVDSSFKAPFFGKTFNSDNISMRILKSLAKHSPRYRILSEIDQSKFEGTWEFDIKRVTSDILHTSLKNYLLILEDILEFDSSKSIGGINKPVLIIQGMKDMIIPPKTASLMGDRIKTSWVDYIENANHILVINNPSDLSEEIYKFLGKIGLK